MKIGSFFKFYCVYLVHFGLLQRAQQEVFLCHVT